MLDNLKFWQRPCEAVKVSTKKFAVTQTLDVLELTPEKAEMAAVMLIGLGVLGILNRDDSNYSTVVGMLAVAGGINMYHVSGKMKTVMSFRANLNFPSSPVFERDADIKVDCNGVDVHSGVYTHGTMVDTGGILYFIRAFKQSRLPHPSVAPPSHPR